MIIQALAISLIVLFLHYTSWEGEIFGGIQKLIKPEGKLYKPIYGCPVCMTPWWGSLIYWLAFGVGWQDWLLTIGVAAGFSVISIILLSLRDAALKYEDS